MDFDSYLSVLLSFLTVGAVVLMIAGIKANAGQSTWATKGMAFSGVMLALLASIGFLGSVVKDYLYNPEAGWWWFALAAVFIVYGIGLLGFCARFGATRRRIVQLEEIESALSAAVSHSAAQSPSREDSSS